MGKGGQGTGKGKVGMLHCYGKGKGRPGEREGKGGHVQCCEKRERKAREEGREMWACDNVVKKGKSGQGRRKGKVGM